MMVLNPQLIVLENMSEQEVIESSIEVYTDSSRTERRIVRLRKRIYAEVEEEIFKIGRIIVLKYFGAYEVMELEESWVRMRKLNREVKELK